jgi:high-affinity nickel permease
VFRTKITLVRVSFTFPLRPVSAHDFIALLPRLTCHLLEWMKLPLSVHSFIAQFHSHLVVFNFCMELMIIYVSCDETVTP